MRAAHLAKAIATAAKAPAGVRWKLLRALLARRSDIEPGRKTGQCPFTQLAKYAEDYARLAALFGRPNEQPPPGETAFLDQMRQRLSPRPGSVGPDDYAFLTACISILAPRRVVEIGTLTGFSAAIMAAALERRFGQDAGARVETIDISRQCGVERSRLTGFEIEEFAPMVQARVRLHNPHDSAHVATLAREGEIDFAFIDAGHRHPHPLLDLLRVARWMVPGRWIALHDIRLGTMGREAEAAGVSLSFHPSAGAELLFANWPFPKIDGGNIGVVQLPADRCDLVAFGFRLTNIPFEVEAKKRAGLQQSLSGALADLA